MMRLWLLRPVGNWYSTPPAAWNPWYDKTFGFVVRAETEQQARAIASKESSDEGCNAWLDVWQSDCIELTTDGDEGVVIQDHWAA